MKAKDNKKSIRINNIYAQTMLVEAKYSLIARGYPINDKEKTKKYNYDIFKIALEEEIPNLKIDNEVFLEEEKEENKEK